MGLGARRGARLSVWSNLRRKVADGVAHPMSCGKGFVHRSKCQRSFPRTNALGCNRLAYGTSSCMPRSTDLSFGHRRIVSRSELLAAGLTGRDITEAVRGAQLIRVRRDHYGLPGIDRHTLEAVRVGGLLACVSAAGERGIFVFDDRFTHVHIDREGSRLRSPRSRDVPLAAASREGVQLHWTPLLDGSDVTEYCVGVRDALSQIIRCQDPDFAVAALDTALHNGAIDPAGVSEIFAHLPAKYQELQFHIDTRVDAGQESVLRRLIHRAGLRCTIQVEIRGVGRIDILVEDCVVVEADSRAHHKDWEQHIRDRSRDRRLAELGFVSLRVLYQDIMFDPDGVIRAIRELVRICHEGSRRS
jgi:very-short-patch-repair endonuclease